VVVVLDLGPRLEPALQAVLEVAPHLRGGDGKARQHSQPHGRDFHIFEASRVFGDHCLRRGGATRRSGNEERGRKIEPTGAHTTARDDGTPIGSQSRPCPGPEVIPSGLIVSLEKDGACGNDIELSPAKGIKGIKVWPVSPS